MRLTTIPWKRTATNLLMAGVILAGVSVLRAADLPAPADRKVDFSRDVKPLLAKHCWSCHGAEKQESGLRLDRRAALLAGGDSGKAVVPGKSAESRLIHLVAATDPKNVMPPDGEPLKPLEVGLLRAWIDQGCDWPAADETPEAKNDHWAYQPLREAMPPRVRRMDWPVNAIDHFILAELEKRELSPSPEAPRTTLIRRLSLDLTGLLPTVEEVDAFVQDARPNAYELLVDRLLQSPHFGERWGRHWLDMARYADSDGYEKDNARPDAYRWRDWVIDAFNNDLPFDQFTIEQLAGDLLPDATPMQKLATAFHRQTLTNTEGGTDQEQFRVEACFDRTETTGSVWLGLTVTCARCHSHKYEAISQREYYQLFAVFNNGDEQTTVVPKSVAEVEEYGRAKAAHDAQLAALDAKIQTEQEKLEPAIAAWEERTQKQLAADRAQPLRTQALEAASYSSDGGVEFESQKDGSVLVKGPNPERVVYTVQAKLPAQPVASEWTSLRLDVLPDPSLPAKGPGRVAHGNFVLSEVTLEVASQGDFSDAKRVEFAGARADFEQADRPWKAAGVIDGDDATGWAIAPQFGKEHWISLDLKEALKGDVYQFVRLRLSHQYGKQHAVGRFRATLRSGREPSLNLPKDVVKALDQPREKRNAKERAAIVEQVSLEVSPTKELLAEREELRKKAPAKPELTVRVLAQRTQNPRSTYVLKRGEFLDPIKELEAAPGGLGILPPLKPRNEGASADRLDLARWLVAPENPLTPRVAANHVWRLLFGAGLVRTPNDFGVRGERPTHPELLDWLARDFQGIGSARPWSRKTLIKRIVMSATYRQSSRHRPELREVDPQNLLLARQNRLRVEAEIVRDLSLDAAGLLSRKVGGPSVFPPLPPGIAELSYAGNFKWNVSGGSDRHRRGMYTFFKRTAPHPNLTTFDCPDANIACVERKASNTPLQALTTLNNETFAEAARALAKRVLAVSSQDDGPRLVEAFRICLARNPSDAEVAELRELLVESRKWYAAHPDQAKLLVNADAVAQVPLDVNAAWITTARVLLNLDEFITRE
jgi:cytochrome c553